MEIDRLRKEIRVNERLNSAADKQSRLFTYDGVFDSNVGQCEVYDHVVAPLIDEVLSGYNCTVFAYGQTGTGKTYTMEGERSDFECSWQDDPRAGIVPRALDQLFENLSDSGCSQVAVSYMELYNEKLYDLLNPTDDFASLSIYEDKGGKVKIGRLAQIAVTKKEEIFEILQKGSAKRQKAETKLNSCSSRSHTIFTVTIRSKDPDALLAGEEVYRIGKLNLVDLAGSENIGRSGAVEKRAAEAGNINKSLLTLGRVITSLVERQNHIPYRESKLTRLLQDSLGGGTKTSIIATISPNILDVEDTLSTLDYAQRAKKIQNKPEVNQKVARVDILRDVEEELMRMRRDLEAARCGTNAFVISKENYMSMETQIANLGKEVEEKNALVVDIQTRISDLEAEKERINNLFCVTQQKLGEETKKRIETENALDETERNLKVTVEERNEQKYLVDYRVQKESVLLSQATQLCTTAKLATDQLGKIHEKVARVHELHENSVSKIEITRQEFDDHVKQLQSFIAENFNDRNLDAISSISKKQFDHLIQTLSVVLALVEKFTGSVSSGVTSLFNSSTDDKLIVHTSELIKSTQGLEMLKKEHSFGIDEALKVSLNKLYETLNTFIESLSRQRTSSEECLMNLSQQVTQASCERDKEYASLKSNMLDIFDDKTRENALIAAEIHSTKELIMESSNATLSQIAEVEEFFSTKFKEMKLRNSKFSTSLLEKVDSLSTRLLNSDQHILLVKEQINSVVSDSKKREEARLKMSSSFVDQLDSALARDYQSNVDMIVGAKSQMTEQFDTISGIVDESHSIEIKLIGDMLTAEKSVLTDMKSTFEAHVRALNKLRMDVEEQAEPLREKITETVELEVPKIVEAVDNEIYSSKLHQESAQKTISKDFSSLMDQIKTLKLKKYQATGETPQKTIFTFPTNLCVSSPHERVLRRFKGDMTDDLALAIVTELPKSSDLFSSSESIDSCGTSSSNASNRENKIPKEEEQTFKISKLKSKSKSSKSDNANVLKKRTTLQSTN